LAEYHNFSDPCSTCSILQFQSLQKSTTTKSGYAAALARRPEDAAAATAAVNPAPIAAALSPSEDESTLGKKKSKGVAPQSEPAKQTAVANGSATAKHSERSSSELESSGNYETGTLTFGSFQPVAVSRPPGAFTKTRLFFLSFFFRRDGPSLILPFCFCLKLNPRTLLFISRYPRTLVPFNTLSPIASLVSAAKVSTQQSTQSAAPDAPTKSQQQQQPQQQQQQQQQQQPATIESVTSNLAGATIAAKQETSAQAAPASAPGGAWGNAKRSFSEVS